MNAPPSCRTCVKFLKCLEATRYYPCREYRRINFKNQKREVRKNERHESEINIY